MGSIEPRAAIFQPSEYPCFVRPLTSPDDGAVVALDGWSILPTGLSQFDFATGEGCAREALAYATQISDHNFITFVVASILFKVKTGEIECSDIEQGFFSVICKRAFCGSHN